MVSSNHSRAIYLPSFSFFYSSREQKSQTDAIKVIKSLSPSVFSTGTSVMLEVAVKKASENLLAETEVKTQLKDTFL